MKKDEYEMIDKLYECCEEFTYTVITCIKCNKEVEVRVDAFYASKKFYSAGWRIIKDSSFCPECIMANTK